MSNKNEVFEYLIDQLRSQVNNNPYKQQCEDLAHEVQSLKNQLRDMSELVDALLGTITLMNGKSEHISHLTGRVKDLAKQLAEATGDVEAYKLARKGEHGPEQSSCRGEDTQECEHEWRVVQYSAGLETNKCRLCGAEKEVRYK